MRVRFSIVTIALCLVVVTAVITTLVGEPPASARAAAAAATPGTTPIKNRPQFHGDDAVVEAIAQIGNRTVVAGHGITSYSQGNGTNVTSSGAGLTATAPGDPTRVAWTGTAGGEWWSLMADPDGHSFYAGSSVGVSKFDSSTGKRVWFHSLGKQIGSIERIPGTNLLIVAGYFSGGLTALRMDTGATASYSLPKLNSGGYIRHADVQPHGNHWVGIGGFSKVGTVARSQAVMLTLGATGATVTAWDSPLLHGANGSGPCARIFPNFLRDVAFLHSGSAFFVDGTGGQNNGMCDAVSRFEMSNLSTQARPTWMTGTCMDTFLSVGVAPDDSYLMVGGHFKCIGQQHNPTRGFNVSRFAIAALDPSSGAVLPWKSDKCRAEGTRVFAWVTGGVAVGYDCKFWGNSESINPQPSPQTPRDRFAVLPNP
jgi:hypothetical protein